MSINIGKSSKQKGDKNFRYQRDPLQIKDEGRGNGVKTIITNVEMIAHQLHVPTDYITKFIGFKRGTRTEFKENIGTVVYGRHTAASLTQYLEEFIEEVVVCPKCELPCETTFEAVGERLVRDCRACGCHKTMKSSKIVDYIIKQLGTGKKQKHRTKIPQDTRDVQQIVPEPVDDDDLITGDTSKEAIAARRAAEISEMKASPSTVDVGRVDDPVEILRLFMSKPREPSEVVSEVRRLELTRGLDHKQKFQILIEALIPFDASIVKKIESNLQYIKPFVRDDTSQLHLICAIEQFVGEKYPDLISKMGLILQVFYVADVVSEESIMLWNTTEESTWITAKGGALRVRAKTAPFIDALKSAKDNEPDEDE